MSLEAKKMQITPADIIGKWFSSQGGEAQELLIVGNLWRAPGNRKAVAALRRIHRPHVILLMVDKGKFDDILDSCSPQSSYCKDFSGP